MKGGKKKMISGRKLRAIIFRRLVLLVIIVFVAAAVVGLAVQNYFGRRQAYTLLQNYIEYFDGCVDVDKDIEQYMYKWKFHDPNSLYYLGNGVSNEQLSRWARINDYFISEISLVDENGIVAQSSAPGQIGVDLHDDEYLSEFLRLLDEKGYYARPFSPNPFKTDKDLKMAYSGISVDGYSGIVLFGRGKEAMQRTIDNSLSWDAANLRPGATGFVLACNSDKSLVAAPSEKYQEDIGMYETYSGEVELPEEEDKIKEQRVKVFGVDCYVSAVKKPDYYMIAAYPVHEANVLRNKENTLFVGLFILVLAVLFIVLYRLINDHVVSEVTSIHSSLEKITEGDLDQKADSEGSLEFYELSKGINDTVSNLKDRIQAAKDQLAAEMENARRIQESAVPQIFLSDERFSLFASMDTAEAVGGDFYDFFMTGSDTLAFVIADVSGKGMPAALYMMRAKALIKTFAMQGLPVEEVAKETNAKLCEDAAKDMFVTAWIGFLDLNTGVLSYVHAGHTYPLLMHNGGVSFVKQKINMVLGGLRKAKYARQELKLAPGDCIFLYTDGVSEAHNASGEMYGDARLYELISDSIKGLLYYKKNGLCRAGCEMVKKSVMDFAGEASQFDDITMMWVSYDK